MPPRLLPQRDRRPAVEAHSGGEAEALRRLARASSARYRDDMPASLPVVALTVLGILIAVLGLFVAGNLTIVIVGLVAIAVAGVLEVLGRQRSR